MVTSITPFSAPLFQGFEPYDMDKDFQYVGGFMPQERLLVVRKDEPYSKSWKDLVKYAKEHPKGLSCGASGSVSSMEVIKSITVVEGIKFKYVLFQNASAALMGGHIDICEAGVGTPAYQGAKKGDLNAILNIGGGKVPGMPEVPNVYDFNYPFQTYRFYGFIFQGKVPEHIRQKWENALQEVLNDPAIRQKMEKLGFQIQFKNGLDYKDLCTEYVKSRVELLKHNKKHFKY
jgi:tripartite-type tricarboxylate transporter receptor subunit TctC